MKPYAHKAIRKALKDRGYNLPPEQIELISKAIKKAHNAGNRVTISDVLDKIVFG